MAGCGATKASGEHCGAQAMTGYRHCYVHAPEMAEKRKKTNRKGGKSGGRGRPKEHMGRVHQVADAMIAKLLRGEIEPGVAAVVIQAGNLKLRAVLADLKITEQLELTERLEELERLLEEKRKELRRY